MESDPPEPQTLAQKIQTLKPSLSSSLAKLSGSSRGIPSDKDFHFYNNFDEFSLPIKQISDKSSILLSKIASANKIWGKDDKDGKDLAFPVDMDDAYDFLVNVNDEVYERFDCSIDEFKGVGKKGDDSGFQVVCGKKKRENLDSGVKVATRDRKTMVARPKVPFHIPTIPRPQDKYKIVVNNGNQPFQHVWLQSSEDGSRLVHPQEKFSALDFVDRNVGDMEQSKPLPVECTPFKLVEEVKDLKELAAKLRSVNEFAVDLEHNHYRSFQGLTCLMQISTRKEDFIVDTLKLRVHVGPYLREVFKDPAKKKIMHGSESDIVWLQRDFGIYICNLFDTGQASRVLKLERKSLEYLLNYFCGVTANKEYQQADWRLRPLPEEMVKYAREDTHYLLHIYDLMRIRLLSTSPESEKPEDLLLEVYQRSYDICMHIYEKEIQTDSSYLHIYGLRDADFNAQQLAVVQGLCDWRDIVARAEDESTGYILPNKTLLEIAKQMPVSNSKLRQLLNSKHPYIERHLGAVVGLIKHSLQNAAAFEPVVEQLKIERMEREKAVAAEGNEAPPPSTPVKLRDPLDIIRSVENHSYEQQGVSQQIRNGSICIKAPHNVTAIQTGTSVTPGQGSGVTIQMLKKPTSAFGAMFGNSSTKRKLDSTKLEKEEIKLEKIKSSVNLPFHSFVGGSQQSQSQAKEPSKVSDAGSHTVPAKHTEPTNDALEDVILLEGGESDNDNETEKPKTENEQPEHKEITYEGEEPMSLSDLSTNFKKCFQSVTQKKAHAGFLQVKPFDYEAARKEIVFGKQVKKAEKVEEGDETIKKNKFDNKKSKAAVPLQKEEGEHVFAPGRRRQAFPASGNRNATFRQ